MNFSPLGANIVCSFLIVMPPKEANINFEIKKWKCTHQHEISYRQVSLKASYHSFVIANDRGFCQL